MQNNVREDIIVWVMTKDDFKEEGDSQIKETDSDDDGSSNTYAFKVCEEYN